MIYKFKSKATGDLIMLEENGRTILKIIGKTDPQILRQGILLPTDMPAAIKALQNAVLDEDARLTEGGHARPNGVSLRQRSLPFIQMLHRCHAQEKEIVWGV